MKHEHTWVIPARDAVPAPGQKGFKVFVFENNIRPSLQATAKQTVLKINASVYKLASKKKNIYIAQDFN